MALAKFCRPIRSHGLDARKQPVAAIKLDGMALAIAETDHLEMVEALQGPGQAGGGILPAGKQHQRGFGWGLSAHLLALSTHRSFGQSVEISAISACSAGIAGPLAA